MRKKVWVGFVAVFLLISPLYGQSTKGHWVDSVFRTLDLDGKIGQVLMVPANSYSDQQTLEKLAGQIKKFRIGGVVFTQGGPVSQAHATNFLQRQATVPLLIG